MKITFNELVGATMAIIAVLTVAFASIFQDNANAMTAMVGAVGTAIGYFLRAKLETPK